MFRLAILVLAVSVTQAFLFNVEDKWNDLRVTWGPNPFNSNYYSQMPRVVDDALVQGFRKISDCDNTVPWRGQRYVKGDDFAVVLLYDVNGFIAGIQTSIPNNLPNGYPKNANRKIFKKDYYRLTITAYFTNPGDICTKGRTQEDFDKEGTGSKLYLQLSDNPEESVAVPMTESGAMAASEWTEGKCFYTMGKHFWYNISYDMSCDDFFPVFLLYNNGRLNGFGWALEAALTSSRYEHPTSDKIPFFMKTVPKCLTTNPALSTMHIYMTEHPMWNRC